MVRFLMRIQIYFCVPKERQNNQHLSLKIMLLSLCQALSWCKTSTSSWNEKHESRESIDQTNLTFISLAPFRVDLSVLLAYLLTAYSSLHFLLQICYGQHQNT